MTTSEAALEEGKASVELETLTSGTDYIAIDRQSYLQETEVVWRSAAKHSEFIEIVFGAESKVGRVIVNESGATKPDDDLTADEWELAKTAARMVVAERLDRPDDFLADIRMRIANI